MNRQVGILGLLILGMLACNLTPKRPPTSIPTPSPSISSASSPMPAALNDASSLFQHVCFDAWLPLDGNSFILNNQAALQQLLTELDARCNNTIAVPTVDFSEQIIVGAVRIVTGCDATFVPQFDQDLHLLLRLDVVPGCDYQLVAIFAATFDQRPLAITIH